MHTHNDPVIEREKLAEVRTQRAQAIAAAGCVEEAMATGALPHRIDATLSELIVLGLLRQSVCAYVGVFGHGSTEIGEVLRVYEQAGLVRLYPVRHETEASHAAAALRWVTGEKAAVVTSIGPGALHALAGSITPASDGLGVWYLLGDETTHDEGPNMQQIPKHEQHLYLQLCATMGRSYCLHTPEAIGTALRRGLNTVDHPHRGGPFYLLMPMNTQAQTVHDFNLDQLPTGAPPSLGAAADGGAFGAAAQALQSAERVVVRLGGGARKAGPQILSLLDRVDGLALVSPIVTGLIPDNHPRNMSVGGSKGSISGNWAMDEADLLIAIGTRSVCQSDSSRTGYPKVQHVININTDLEAATHYAKTTALLGDAGPTIEKFLEYLDAHGVANAESESAWMQEGRRQRQAWNDFKTQRYQTPCLHDAVWQKSVLTQPAAIKIATDWARERDAVCFFDAGDVQANGFQVAEDDRLGRTFTDTGASYMGFAVSALLATSMASEPFYGLAITGDGSFTMNPQILIDGVQHGATGCILLLDNRRMGAISGLQDAQYGAEHGTSDQVVVDYPAWAESIRGVGVFKGGETPHSLQAALTQAIHYKGLSLIHLPVYYGSDPLGNLGAYGRWNVGNWCDAAQALRQDIGL